MRHRDIVLVPSYFRPEFLFLCLEKIYEADQDCNKDVWISHDRKFDDDKQFSNELLEIENVIEYWKRAFGNRLRALMRCPHGFYGNSRNVLESYKQAYQTDAELIYLVEDDILVTPDFFKWHEAVHKADDYLCTIAGTTNRNPFRQETDGGAYFESSLYASLGVCWRRENLQYVVEHAVPEYYHNLAPYIMEKFPQSSLGLAFVEQDGLVQRLLEATHAKVAFACVPKAYHIGLWGYHRSIGQAMVPGYLPDRIEKYRQMLSDPKWLAEVAGFQSDIQPYPATPPSKWERVHRV